MYTKYPSAWLVNERSQFNHSGNVVNEGVSRA
jgi:hypothetical protein